MQRGRLGGIRLPRTFPTSVGGIWFRSFASFLFPEAGHIKECAFVMFMGRSAAPLGPFSWLAGAAVS
jgi:hypothetical protein